MCNYKNVKALLSEEKKPELYSFDKETDNEKYLSVENSIERYYIYKSGNVNKQSAYTGAVRYREINEEMCKSITDCDNCELAKNMYKILWADAINDSENSAIDGKHGDTMTSLQHSLNLAFKLTETEEDRKKYFKGKRVSLSYQIELFYHSPDDFASRAGKLEGFEHFARIYHTMGNLIPVPKGFNVSRSHGGADDYWDVTLTKIKEWYDTKDNNALIQLLTEETVNLCKKWLTWYGSWENFIDKNYLQDFVDSKYEPIRFKPESPEEVENFFKECSDLIEKRGKRIVDELKKKVGE